MGKTLLVVGAGASSEYGLHCGKELKDWILSKARHQLVSTLAPENPMCFGPDDEDGLAFVETPVVSFLTAFRAAATSTIDKFLQFQPSHRDLGRLAIALCLLQQEVDAVEALNFDRGFYPAIAETMLAPKDGIWPDNLEIISFNYDRTLELIVSAIYAARFGREHASKCREHLERHIIHVYGSFSMPYSYSSQLLRFTPQNRWSGSSGKIAPREYLVSSKDIAVIGDERSAKQVDLGSKMLEADRIFFLGFGFDETNLKILGIEKGVSPLKLGCQVRSTGFKLAQRSRDRVVEVLPNIEFGAADIGCASFIADHGGF